jgi:1-acyl-sn-glycerol-3-phosphate acyltransferase
MRIDCATPSSAAAAPGNEGHKPRQLPQREETAMSDEETRTGPSEESASSMGEQASKPTSETSDVVSEVSDEELRQELVSELDELTQRLQALTPDHEPPPFSPKGLVALIEEALARCPKEIQLGILERLRGILNEDLFDPEIWKGAWYMLNYTVQYNTDLVKRRFSGEYDTDEWGMDWEFLDVMRPFFTFLYKTYWRVEATGIEQIPIEGPALLAANHSGQLPWDGLMIGTAVLTEHPAQRLVRTLYGSFLPRLPFASSWLVRLGQTLDVEDNGVRMLEQEEVVAVFPEGYEGMGKPLKDRYKLARFGQGDFVKMALSTGAPIIPVSVVGAEETYISLAKVPTKTGSSGLPYVPVSLTFPWLGLLGLVPLPTKWYIDFGEPIAMDGYGPEAALNLVLVAQLTDQVRHSVQEMLHSRLAQRGSAFLG